MVHAQRDVVEAEVKEEMEHAKADLDQSLEAQVGTPSKPDGSLVW